MTVSSSPRVAVVGAGVVGLCTAWYLRELGADVTVLDRRGPAAGASWGNAGWLSPGLSTPLPEPAMLRYGIRAMVRPDSPLRVAITPPSARLARFLLGLARHSTQRHWRHGMQALGPLNASASAAWQELCAAACLSHELHAERPILAVFADASEARSFADELEHLRSVGQPLTWEPVTAIAARKLEPALTARVRSGALIRDQQYVDPRSLVPALAATFTSRGGRLLCNQEVHAVVADGSKPRVVTATHSARFDHVVLANGADLDGLAAPHGVRRRVQAGRGYSFSVSDHVLSLSGPLYVPAQKVACTPLGDGRVRFAGTMEFTAPDAPTDRRRITAIKRNVEPYLSADLGEDGEQWVGSRPCTVDGLPLVGPTRTPGVHVNGGYGMWGMTLAPVVARLLAPTIMSGERSPQLASLDPSR